MKNEKMKTVLIALDYDKSAQKVAEIGYKMANSMEAEVILLHVIADQVYYSTTGYSPILGFTGYTDAVPVQLDSVEALKKASQDFLDKTKQHLGDDQIVTVVKEGDLTDGILKTAKKYHAEVIVMGSHSHKWLEDVVLGSATNDVLKKTNLPMFIIPIKKHE